MRFLQMIKVADLFTLANGLLGFIAITYIIDGQYLVASLLILVAMVMDGLDGYFARRLGTERAIGRVLDSISDSISFCIAPALLIYGIFFNKDKFAFADLHNFLTVVASGLMAIFGILRLVRYAGKDFAAKTFLGLPTPATALMVILLCYLFAGEDTIFFSLAYMPYIVLPACIGMAVVMISDIPYPKVRGWVQRATLVGIVLTAIPAMIAIFDSDWSIVIVQVVAVFAFVLTAGYVIGGPVINLFADGRGNVGKAED
jgi:CDP-diacylglycerol--serine O-phosphatidyltransferase